MHDRRLLATILQYNALTVSQYTSNKKQGSYTFYIAARLLKNKRWYVNENMEICNVANVALLNIHEWASMYLGWMRGNFSNTVKTLSSSVGSSITALAFIS